MTQSRCEGFPGRPFNRQSPWRVPRPPGKKVRGEGVPGGALARQTPNFDRPPPLALNIVDKWPEASARAAADQLVQGNELMAGNEIRLTRRVAGRAAVERAVHFSPGDAELREQFEALFGPDARLPEAARKKYVFRPTAKPV